MKKTQCDRRCVHLQARLRRHLRICQDLRKRRSIRKRAARSASALAERLGLLRRPRGCQWCQHATLLERHHWDYTDPMLVSFLCPECHAIANRMVRGQPLLVDEPVILPFRREECRPARPEQLEACWIEGSGR